MKDLISELKQRYDFVFFDSPPIMGVSDASILASEVDMTLQDNAILRSPAGHIHLAGRELTRR